MRTINSMYLVDDDEIFKFLTNKIIKESKMVNKIWMFSNGLEALSSLLEAQKKEKNLPEIILLDLTMPIMDGWEFLEEFSQIKLNLPEPISIYIVSSSISPKDIARVNDYSSVKDYVIKPITKAKFIELLEHIQ